jgi:hypothetical protein
LITIAVADDILGHNIAWHIAMNACGVWSQSITAIGNGRERLIVNVDTRGSIFREIAVLRDHHGQRVADVADFIAREHERSDVIAQTFACYPDEFAHRLPERRAFRRHMRPQILQREDRVHAGHRARSRDVDLAHGSVAERAAHECGRQRPGQSDVIDKICFSAEQGRIFDPPRAPADNGSYALVVFPSCRALGDRKAGIDDVLVAGAAAQMPRERVAHSSLIRVRIHREQLGQAHEYARRTETTLQGMMVAKRFLQGVEALVGRQALDCCNLAAVRLHGERQAAARRLAIEEDGARSADAVLATEMRPLEA